MKFLSLLAAATLPFLQSPALAAEQEQALPRIASLEPKVAAPNRPVVISGSGFGRKKGGRITIGGHKAWTTTWSDNRIVAYVPPDSQAGDSQVEITTGNAQRSASNLNIQAEAPSASGAIAWRFETLANYISHRADVARDGTVYFNDSSGFLYALTPSGALKWIYDGEGGGSQGPTVVGRDGTIYFGTSSLSAIHAVNPDGTRKWIFVAPDSQGLIGGPGIGPDGNIYAVFDIPGSIGAISLAPTGALRWNRLGSPTVAEYGQTGKELVFGGGNVYWTSTYFGYLYAFDLLQGDQVFVAELSRPGQAAAVLRNGTVYVPTGIAPRLLAYTKTGQLRWSFFGDEPGVTNVLSAPDLSRDGSIYIDRNQFQVYSLTPRPTVRWISNSLLPQGPVPGPIVSPANDLVLIGGQQTYGQPGLIQAFSTADGSLLFQLQIPNEPDGTCVVPYARARFTRRGDRAYIPAVQLCQTPAQYHSWLYAVDLAQ